MLCQKRGDREDAYKASRLRLQGLVFFCHRSLQTDGVTTRNASAKTSTKSLPAEVIPPLPPRQASKRASTRSHDAPAVNGAVPTVPPRSGAGAGLHQRTHSDDTDCAPTRPPKRRKINQSSPVSSHQSSFTKVRTKRQALRDVKVLLQVSELF